MISSIALIVSCRQPFIVVSVNLKDDPPRACWVEEKHIHSSCGQWKFWHLKPLTNQSICVLSPFLWLHSKRGDNLSALSVWCTVITCDLFDREPVISLIWPSVHGRSPPHPPPNQAAAWRVIAEPPCFDALDLYDLKSHFHFSDHRKKRTYLVNCKKANILPPLLSPLLPPFLISLWKQNAENHFHFHSSMLISHLKAPSATINITAPTERDATMRNYQQSQEAICFNVECVLLQLTAIFLIHWQLSSDTLWKTEGSVRAQHYNTVKYTVQTAGWGGGKTLIS